eukprot:Sspe_Gene.47731::Locus_24487_Transcript_2_2_Confidence_1.000_Length_472::g.47731::m.47731
MAHGTVPPPTMPRVIPPNGHHDTHRPSPPPPLSTLPSPRPSTALMAAICACVCVCVVCLWFLYTNSPCSLFFFCSFPSLPLPPPHHLPLPLFPKAKGTPPPPSLFFTQPHTKAHCVSAQPPSLPHHTQWITQTPVRMDYF